jgi:exopolyphosphatase/guanosine-5'-triphosphate,3'-diphosphate pyrophosphatase
MKIALIDCGTNTFHFLLAEVKKDHPVHFLVKEQVPVMIGEGGLVKKEISASAFQRGINCLKNFHEIIKKTVPDKTLAYGTAALRNATNGHLFVKAVLAETGIELNIIDGEQEAELIYYGVKHALSIHGPELIMDIGGGSTELMVADENKIHWLRSYEAGASLLREKFRFSDPITVQEREQVENWLAITFESFINDWKGKIHVLNGSAGSFETLMALTFYRQGKTPPGKNEISGEIEPSAFVDVYHHLLQSTREERLKMKGLPEFRVDIIIPAVILINFIITQTGIRKIRWSAYSLKEGMLFKTAGL